jgi:flagellar protein FliS
MTPPTASPQSYRENTVLTATPEQLVVMLYDGVQRFLRNARTAIQAREIERAHNSLRRAELIIAHLDTVLDHEHDAGFAERLSSIYRFCLAHLARARLDLDDSKVAEVARLLAELRVSWATLAAGGDRA